MKNQIAFKRDLCQRIMAYDFEKSNVLAHAQRELAILESKVDVKNDSPGAVAMQKCMTNNLLEMLAVFATQGHSGMSASYATRAITQLLDYKPLTPIWGTEDEWMEIGRDMVDGVCYQNRRHSSVFKDDHRAYQSGGVVFKEPNGSCYSSGASRQTVEFPYVPMVIYVDVDLEGNCLDGWDKKGDHPNWNPHGSWKPSSKEKTE